MPLIVRINPDKTVDGKPIAVLHPATRRPFPAGEDITLSDADLADPRMLRLLPPPGAPGGVPGGHFADLVPVVAKPAAKSNK